MKPIKLAFSITHKLNGKNKQYSSLMKKDSYFKAKVKATPLASQSS